MTDIAVLIAVITGVFLAFMNVVMLYFTFTSQHSIQTEATRVSNQHVDPDSQQRDGTHPASTQAT